MNRPAVPTSDASLRRQLAVAGACGLLAVFMLGESFHRLVPLSAWYLLKAAALFAFIMVTALTFMGGHHPFARLGPANQVTTARAGLVALSAGFIGEPAAPLGAMCAAALGLLGSALDNLDGWLARRSGLASPFGARFDMEIDALLVMTLSILAWQHGRAGAWFMLSGLLRYAFVAAGWLFPSLRAPLPERMRRKAICVIQIVGSCVLLLPVMSAPLSAWAAAGLLLLLAYSFLADIVWLSNRVE